MDFAFIVLFIIMDILAGFAVFYLCIYFGAKLLKWLKEGCPDE